MMKKFLKRTLCLLLAGIMLTGCGKSNGSSSKNETTGNTTNQINVTENVSKISDKEITVSVLLMDSPMQPLKNFAPAQQEIFKKTNIKLDYQIVPSSSYKDKKSILLGTNNFPDIVYLQNMDDIVTYGSSGIFEPLLQYVNEETMPNFYKFWSQYPEMKKFLLEGELYVFPIVAKE